MKLIRYHNGIAYNIPLRQDNNGISATIIFELLNGNIILLNVIMK